VLFAQSSCTDVDVINEGVYRVQSRRKCLFLDLSSRSVGELGKEIPAPASAASCGDLFWASRAPSFSNGPLSQMMRGIVRFAGVDRGRTASMHDRALVKMA
jgi:hypothetical protein